MINRRFELRALGSIRNVYAPDLESAHTWVHTNIPILAAKKDYVLFGPLQISNIEIRALEADIIYGEAAIMDQVALLREMRAKLAKDRVTLAQMKLIKQEEAGGLSLVTS